MRLILASGSARRPELLAALGVAFEVIPANVDESSPERDPQRLAVELAHRKARAVASQEVRAAVIGADTLVTLDGHFFGKPADAEAATATLQKLRGRTHQVVSGVAIAVDGVSAAASVVTHVIMRYYTDDEIAAFVATGRPFDKSGAYAIQDADFAPVASYEGCMCSVIGLPLWTARRLLHEVAGIEASAPSYDRCEGCPLRP